MAVLGLTELAVLFVFTLTIASGQLFPNSGMVVAPFAMAFALGVGMFVLMF